MNSKPTFSFYVNELKKAKNENWPIYMRLTYNRKKKELDTGYYSGGKDWNLEKQRTKKNDTTNDALSNLESRFYTRINDFKKAESAIDLELLKDYITNSTHNEIPKLKDYISTFCKMTDLRTDIGKPTKYRFIQIQKTIEAYLSSINKSNLLLTGVDFKLIDGYDSFLMSSSFYGTVLSQNTIAKYHSRFRTICLKAMNEGLIAFNPYHNFKLKTVPTSRKFLTLDEIIKIEQLELKNASLERVRDTFLFSLYTSLRFSDVSALSTDNLYKDSDGQLNIKWIIQKTREQISLPLLDIPIRIIEKYSGSAEATINNRLLPTISNQKANTYLKVISDLAGININLTYHVARHSFATTIWLENGFPVEVLQKILGHKNIKETMIYAKISSNLLKSSFTELNKKLLIV